MHSKSQPCSPSFCSLVPAVLQPLIPLCKPVVPLFFQHVPQLLNLLVLQQAASISRGTLIANKRTTVQAGQALTSQTMSVPSVNQKVLQTSSILAYAAFAKRTHSALDYVAICC